MGRALHDAGTHESDTGGAGAQSSVVRDPVEAFASLVLGHPFGTLDPAAAAAVAGAIAASGRALRSGRLTLPAGLHRASLYREAYRAVRPMATRSGPAPEPGGGPRRASEVALAALLRLRHRQRAVLALRDILGFEAEEIAHVVGVSRAEASRIIERARAALVERAAAPVHPARALQAARRILGVAPPQASQTRARRAPAAGAPPAGRDLARPRRMPRTVVRTLLAPAPGSLHGPAGSLHGHSAGGSLHGPAVPRGVVSGEVLSGPMGSPGGGSELAGRPRLPVCPRPVPRLRGRSLGSAVRRLVALTATSAAVLAAALLVPLGPSGDVGPRAAPPAAAQQAAAGSLLPPPSGIGG